MYLRTSSTRTTGLQIPDHLLALRDSRTKRAVSRDELGVSREQYGHAVLMALASYTGHIDLNGRQLYAGRA